MAEEDNRLGLSFAQSAALLEANPDNPSVIVRHHEQFTLPLTTLLLLTITLPLCFHFGRHSVMPGLLASVGRGALYFAFDRVSVDLAVTGAWNPVVMAWLPTVAFASLGCAMYVGMRS